jgi:hypothetical protein
MARDSGVTSKDRSSSAVVIALVASSLAAGWVWLVAGTHLHEMMVGAGVVVVATLFLLLVHRSQPNRIQLRWKDVAQGWRIPWYLVCDTWVVTLVLLRDLLHLRPAGSHYRVCGFSRGKRDPAVLRRGILATIYMTATPNSIVLGIDPESSKMLFHQLERAGVTKMARDLGAQS